MKEALTMTPRQTALVKMLNQNAKKDGTDFHGALRDLLTDLRHVAASKKESFSKLLKGSKEVFYEETSEEAE
jgi:hypothetical protein